MEYNHYPFWAAQRAKAAPPLHPVHEISAWTGDPDDESPICGANKDAGDVWGYRTVYTNHVTCSACIAAREAWSELQESNGVTA